MIALIDTCIIIDALQARAPFNLDAEQIFYHAANCHFDGHITAKSVADIYYLSHRLTHDDKKTRHILAQLFQLFSPVDTTSADCQLALESSVTDYEDAMMIETAVRIHADCIITRNLKDYSDSPIPVYSPADFLQLLLQ